MHTTSVHTAYKQQQKKEKKQITEDKMKATIEI